MLNCNRKLILLIVLLVDINGTEANVTINSVERKSDNLTRNIVVSPIRTQTKLFLSDQYFQSLEFGTVRKAPIPRMRLGYQPYYRFARTSFIPSKNKHGLVYSFQPKDYTVQEYNRKSLNMDYKTIQNRLLSAGYNEEKSDFKTAFNIVDNSLLRRTYKIIGEKVDLDSKDKKLVKDYALQNNTNAIPKANEHMKTQNEVRKHIKNLINSKSNKASESLLRNDNIQNMESKNWTEELDTNDNMYNLDIENSDYEKVNISLNGNISLLERYINSLDNVEKEFYKSTFRKLLKNSPSDRQENGISFVQSGFLLHLSLSALSSTVAHTVQEEVNNCTNFQANEQEIFDVMKQVVSWLPKSDADLRIRWSMHLILAPGQIVSNTFRNGAAKGLNLSIEYFNSTDNPTIMAKRLNDMIEIDTGGAMRDTFDEDDLKDEVRSVLVSTLYVRGRWRSAPTLLNGSHPFHDAARTDGEGERTTTMIRINDIVQYADLKHWDAEAVEIAYATPGLSLLVVVPRGHSLRNLSHLLGTVGLRDVNKRLSPLRVGVTLPLYTLRMTLLLPSKLRDMGLNSLLYNGTNDKNSTSGQNFKLSHGVQRLMFWAEAGRNAFKDDGIEWDDTPEMELVIDRPYMFFVRWHNVTLMNGHFVL